MRGGGNGARGRGMARDVPATSSSVLSQVCPPPLIVLIQPLYQPPAEPRPLRRRLNGRNGCASWASARAEALTELPRRSTLEI